MQNKRMYIKPVLESETFVPQTYIAVCKDQNVVYKFKCDAGDGESGNVYEDSNHNGRYDPFTDKELTGWILNSYHACGETHEAPTTDEFLDGFYRQFGTLDFQKVKIWTNGNTNIHCTKNLQQDTWETVKS